MECGHVAPPKLPTTEDATLSILKQLSQPDLVRIMTEPRNSLVSQYTSLLAASGVTFKVTNAALQELARQATRNRTGNRLFSEGR